MIVFALMLFVAQGQGAEKPWITDVEKAKELAKKEGKMVLLDFTGSDWCPPCIAMHREVFSKKPFMEYAEKHLVLVELDFPRRKKQDDKLKKTNAALAKKYDIEGFPTYIILDSNGKILDKSVGYQEGGAESFISKLKKFEKKSS